MFYKFISWRVLKINNEKCLTRGYLIHDIGIPQMIK